MSKENINKFVNSLDKGDAKQAGEDLKNALADKVTSSLDDAKTDVARSMFTGQVGADAPEALPPHLRPVRQGAHEHDQGDEPGSARARRPEAAGRAGFAPVEPPHRVGQAPPPLYPVESRRGGKRTLVPRLRPTCPIRRARRTRRRSRRARRTVTPPWCGSTGPARGAW